MSEFINVKNQILIQKSLVGLEWISVKDRFPEREGKYLVCVVRPGRLRMRVAAFTTSAHQKKPHFYGNQTFSSKDITHWMPLPEPPDEHL